MSNLNELTAIHVMGWHKMPYLEDMRLYYVKQGKEHKYQEILKEMEEDEWSKSYYNEESWYDVNNNQWNIVISKNPDSDHWNPKHNWDHTWQIVDKMKEKGYGLILSSDDVIVTAQFTSRETWNNAATHDKLPKIAICKQALNALGVTYEYLS